MPEKKPKSDPIEAQIKRAVINERIKRAAKEQVDSERPKVELVIQSAEDVKIERPKKLFGGRLLEGSFQLMVGPGEAGKGMVSTSLISYLSTGEPFPGETEGRDPMTVLICVTEDSKGVMKSRLVAAGAKLSNVKFIEGPPTLRGGLLVPSPIAFDDDAGRLVEKAQQIGAGALFLETALEHLGSRESTTNFSTSNEFDVRKVLGPIVATLRETKMVGWGVIHPRKSTEGGVEDSISGSAAFWNVSRGILQVYVDPMDKTRTKRLLISPKANYMHKHPDTLRFRIDPWDQDPGEGRVVWGIPGRSLVDRREAQEIWDQIREVRAKKKRKDFAVVEAEEWLKEALEHGERAASELEAEAEDEGISVHTLRKAKVNLKLESHRDKAFPSKGSMWRMPEPDEEEEDF